MRFIKIKIKLLLDQTPREEKAQGTQASIRQF
jgi:hypothetical protein